MVFLSAKDPMHNSASQPLKSRSFRHFTSEDIDRQCNIISCWKQQFLLWNSLPHFCCFNACCSCHTCYAGHI